MAATRAGHFKTLKLPLGAPEEEVRAQYRKLIKECYSCGDEEMAKALNAAYTDLLKPIPVAGLYRDPLAKEGLVRSLNLGDIEVNSSKSHVVYLTTQNLSVQEPHPSYPAYFDPPYVAVSLERLDRTQVLNLEAPTFRVKVTAAIPRGAGPGEVTYDDLSFCLGDGNDEYVIGLRFNIVAEAEKPPRVRVPGGVSNPRPKVLTQQQQERLNVLAGKRQELLTKVNRLEDQMAALPTNNLGCGGYLAISVVSAGILLVLQAFLGGFHVTTSLPITGEAWFFICVFCGLMFSSLIAFVLFLQTNRRAILGQDVERLKKELSRIEHEESSIQSGL